MSKPWGENIKTKTIFYIVKIVGLSEIGIISFKQNFEFKFC